MSARPRAATLAKLPTQGVSAREQDNCRSDLLHLSLPPSPLRLRRLLRDLRRLPVSSSNCRPVTQQPPPPLAALDQRLRANPPTHSKIFWTLRPVSRSGVSQTRLGAVATFAPKSFLHPASTSRVCAIDEDNFALSLRALWDTRVNHYLPAPQRPQRPQRPQPMSHVPMDEPRPSMELAQHSMSDIYQSTPQSATSSHAASSPSLSVFSRGHNPSRSGGSSSSLASSPITRESLDWFAPSKRLEDVREEPQEREEVYDCWSTGSNILEDKAAPHRLSFDLSIMGSPPDSDYSFGDNDNESWFTSNPSVRRSKRQRSAEYPPSGATTRLLSHFPSLSKRWKYKSGVDPQLSIITHMDRAASRNSSGTSSHLISPALSAISKHESHLPPSPVRTLFDDRMSDSSPAPIAIDKVDEGQGEEAVQARTPLLPPIFSELSRKSSPIQSPLQSPSIADAPVFPTSNTPSGTPQLQSLPSPPLSTKPSISSMRQRSRANTGTVPMAQVPALQMLDEHQDEWAPKLGHANFDIDPEPYTPEKMDMDSLQQLRANRDLARNNYEKHREQTGENYGTTSKIYRFTQAKWSQIDAEWEKEIERVTAALRPVAALRPALDVVEDASGKFPKMAEEGMVGVMDVVPARALTMKRTVVATEPPSQPLHQRKRSFIKFISDILGRGNGARP